MDIFRTKPKLSLIRKKEILEHLWYIDAYTELNIENRLALMEIIEELIKYR